MRSLLLPVIVLSGLTGFACTPPEEEEEEGRGREGEGEGEGEGEAPAGCTALTLSGAVGEGFGEAGASYSATVTPNVGGTGPDVASIEFYSETALSPGSTELGAGVNANYKTCTHCVLVFQDADSEADIKAFYATEGTLGLSADPLGGTLSGSLTGVKLVEVTIADETFESTPVAGGACFTIASATLEATTPEEPETP